MIVNFEEYTRDLTMKHAGEVHAVAEILSKCVGESKSITNYGIRLVLHEEYGRQIRESKIRKIVHEIRCRHMITRLIATSKGYYVAQNDSEFLRWIDSLEQRVKSIQDVISAAKQEVNGVQLSLLAS